MALSVDNMSNNSSFIDPTLKKCARCPHEKPLSDFNNCRDNKDGKQSYCRDCQAAYQLKYNYDLSQEAFDVMYRAQGGLCFLCHKTCEQHTKLSVDSPGSPIFKAVQKKWSPALYRVLAKSPTAPESAVAAGSERSHIAQSVGTL